MYKPAQPTSRAHFVLTEDAPDSFGLFTPNLAVEDSNEPGYVKLYRRDRPEQDWKPGSKMLRSDAERLYCLPHRPDSSD